MVVASLTGVAMLGTAATSLIPAPMPHISGDWLIDIKTVVGVGAVVLPATATVTAVFVKLTARLTALEERGALRDKQMEELHGKIDRLPCPGGPGKKHGHC